MIDAKVMAVSGCRTLDNWLPCFCESPSKRSITPSHSAIHTGNFWPIPCQFLFFTDQFLPHPAQRGGRTFQSARPVHRSRHFERQWAKVTLKSASLISYAYCP